MERVHLKNLDTNVYEHPFDKAALNTLRNLPGFDKVTNFILNWAAVRWNLDGFFIHGYDVRLCIRDDFCIRIFGGNRLYGAYFLCV